MSIRYARALTIWAILCPAVAVTAPARAQAVFILHAFAGPDGSHPAADLIQATDGNLYGTTQNGGASSAGTIFKLSLGGTFTLLHSFVATTDGSGPVGGLFQATDGSFYGCCEFGGTNNTGTVYNITSGGTFTLVHTFPAGAAGSPNTDGIFPNQGPIQATDGNLYGTAELGGSSGFGTVYKIALPAGTFSVMHNFAGADGIEPVGALIEAMDGTLFGTTNGSTLGSGSVYNLTLGGGFSTVYTFTPGNNMDRNVDGGFPHDRVIQGTDGNLYGTTSGAGKNDEGTVFKLTPAGSLTVLHEFSAESRQGFNKDGAESFADLVEAPDGSFVGAAAAGGPNDGGTLFDVTSRGSFKVLYGFLGSSMDGSFPVAGLTLANDSKLYGTVGDGGPGVGYVFRLNLNAGEKSLSPTSVDAGGPAFNLTINGTGFAAGTTVNWFNPANSSLTSLTPSSVTSAAVTVSVPSTLTATRGNAYVSVTIPSTGSTNPLLFTILQTTLDLTNASMSTDMSGNYVADVSLKNAGFLTASTVKIKKATLNGVKTTTTLPVSVGNIPSGSTGMAALTFPSGAGTPGQMVKLAESGTFTGGTFTVTHTVMLP